MQLPAHEELVDLVTRYARLCTQLGKEFGSRPLVVPTAEFFPDRFQPSRAGVQRLLQRMQQHAGMADIPINLQLQAEPQAEEACGSLGCDKAGPSQGGLSLLPNAEGWDVHLPAAPAVHAVALTTSLAQVLGAVFLEETRSERTTIDQPAAVSVELTAVGLGFGPLLLEGSYVYTKSCGGPKVAQLTALTPAQLAVVTALFARQHDRALKPALKAASATQRAVLSLASDWEKSNRHLGRALGANPQQLLGTTPEFNEIGFNVFSFLRGRSNSTALAAASGDPDFGDLAQWEQELSKAQHARGGAARRARSADHDELRALVESELGNRSS